MKQEFLQQIFWEVDQDKLAKLSDEQVIARAFSHGTLPAIQELFREYDKSTLRSVFGGMKQTSLDARRYSYFKLVLG